MNRADISDALKSRILLAGLVDEHEWPNVEEETNGILPKFEVSFPVRMSNDTSLKGGTIDREEGMIAITICVAKGSGENAALGLFDQLKSLFEKGTQVSITGGSIQVTREPTIERQGFPDETAFRLPTTIRYVATAT